MIKWTLNKLETLQVAWIYIVYSRIAVFYDKIKQNGGKYTWKLGIILIWYSAPIHS